MHKITNSDYSLPQVYATNIVQILSSGASSPLLIMGRNESTIELVEYVVKPIAFSHMSPQASMREMLASFIAMELGLNIPEPSLINISNEFVDLFDNIEYKQNLHESIGLNFGCKFISGGFKTWQSYQDLGNEFLLPLLHKIFIFDMFIKNIDRNNSKPNILTNGTDCYIIDHEKAFSTAQLFIQPENHWEFTELDLKYLVKKHLFYNHLKGKRINSDDFINSLAILDRHFWEKAEQLIPDAWLDDQFNKIKEGIYNIIENLKPYKFEIRRVLA